MLKVGTTFAGKSGRNMGQMQFKDGSFLNTFSPANAAVDFSGGNLGKMGIPYHPNTKKENCAKLNSWNPVRAKNFTGFQHTYSNHLIALLLSSINFPISVPFNSKSIAATNPGCHWIFVSGMFSPFPCWFHHFFRPNGGRDVC